MKECVGRACVHPNMYTNTIARSTLNGVIISLRLLLKLDKLSGVDAQPTGGLPTLKSPTTLTLEKLVPVFGLLKSSGPGYLAESSPGSLIVQV